MFFQPLTAKTISGWGTWVGVVGAQSCGKPSSLCSKQGTDLCWDGGLQQRLIHSTKSTMSRILYSPKQWTFQCVWFSEDITLNDKMLICTNLHKLMYWLDYQIESWWKVVLLPNRGLHSSSNCNISPPVCVLNLESYYYLTESKKILIWLCWKCLLDHAQG